MLIHTDRYRVHNLQRWLGASPLTFLSTAKMPWSFALLLFCSIRTRLLQWLFTQDPSWIGSNFYTVTEAFKNALEAGDPRIPYIIDLDAPDLLNVVKYSKDGNRTGGFSYEVKLSSNALRILMGIPLNTSGKSFRLKEKLKH